MDRNTQSGSRRGRRLALAAAFAVTALGLATGPAVAQSADTTTWAVRPTPTDAEPSRDAYRLSLQPGQVIHDSFRVHLQSTAPVSFDVYATDAVLSDKAEFDLLPRTTAPTDIGSWITVETPRINLAPGQTLDVPFTLTVPANASPGDHTGGIVASLSTPSSGGGGTVIVDRRIGSRIYARVAGETRSRLEISQLHAEFSGGGFGAGTVRTTFVVRNTGNVRVHAQALTEVTGLFNGRNGSPQRIPELLPGSTLRVETLTRSVRPTGSLHVQIRLVERPAVTGEEPAVTFPGAEAKTSLSVWPWPWLLILVTLVVVTVVVLVVRKRQRRARG